MIALDSSSEEEPVVVASKQPPVRQVHFAEGAPVFKSEAATAVAAPVPAHAASAAPTVEQQKPKAADAAPADRLGQLGQRRGAPAPTLRPLQVPTTNWFNNIVARPKKARAQEVLKNLTADAPNLLLVHDWFDTGSNALQMPKVVHGMDGETLASLWALVKAHVEETKKAFSKRFAPAVSLPSRPIATVNELPNANLAGGQGSAQAACSQLRQAPPH